MTPVLLWFRRDLRLHDNAALSHAAEHGPVVPVYIHAPAEHAPWQPGAASRWWLHHSLAALDTSLRERGTRLILRRGATLESLVDLCRETGARTIFCNRLYEPDQLARDKALHKALQEQGLELLSCPGALLFEPWAVTTGSNGPYKVFTPFWRRCQAAGLPDKTLAAPRSLPQAADPTSEPLDQLQLLPTVDWDREFYRHWEPGEAGALRRLRDFSRNDLQQYATSRDYPGTPATSRLSPHLHFGEVAPCRIVSTARGAVSTDNRTGSIASAENLLRELAWRDFAHHVLYHFPDTTVEPMNPRFAKFPWRKPSPRMWRAWCRGQTGYPIVDAGMRELWATGTMHNRVRMIVASFLTKNCLVHWRYGARWFWDTLVDADLASNSFNWQWVAGSGADAAPYFRIFNPVTQSEKFDKAGAYLRRWVPELRQLPDKWLHRPWQAPVDILDRAGVRLGHDYPQPLVDLRKTRDGALSAYRACMQA